MEVNEKNYRDAIMLVHAEAIRKSDMGWNDAEKEEQINRFNQLALDMNYQVYMLRARIKSRFLGTPGYAAIPALFTEG